MKVGGWETVARGEERGEGQAGGVVGGGVGRDECQLPRSASPISPSLIVGCTHTNITNHYESSTRSPRYSLGLRRMETPPSCDHRDTLTATGPGGISGVEIKLPFRAKTKRK